MNSNPCFAGWDVSGIWMDEEVNEDTTLQEHADNAIIEAARRRYEELFLQSFNKNIPFPRQKEEETHSNRG